jgi:hypothetical protein
VAPLIQIQFPTRSTKNLTANFDEYSSINFKKYTKNCDALFGSIMTNKQKLVSSTLTKVAKLYLTHKPKTLNQRKSRNN